jgi:hypothetical protein
MLLAKKVAYNLVTWQKEGGHCTLTIRIIMLNIGKALIEQDSILSAPLSILPG